MSDTVEILAEADDATLDFIKRDADEYLKAQLAVALAGNQRAMTFFGFLAAASAVIGSASVTALVSGTMPSAFGVVGLAVVGGFLLAMFLANRAAMPDPFEYVGNTPSGWIDDVAERKALARSKAEALAETARCIERNAEVLQRSARFIKRAVYVAWTSLLIGGVSTVIVVTIVALGSEGLIGGWF